MNSCFKRWLILLLFAFAPSSARAVDVGAFYYASCERYLGIVLDVNADEIHLVTIDGRDVTLPRYQVIYWATYPVGDFAVPLSESVARIPRQRVFTRQGYEKVLLVEGWPIDFTENKISFLTPAGTRQVVDVDSIWEIESVNTPPTTRAGTEVTSGDFQFVPPPVFRDCPADTKGARIAYPEQTLSDPVAIKRELDRLEAGHRRMEKYEERQRFYPVPQLYENRTYLGLWHMLGSRYGASSHRANNFTPVLVDQTSKGPFGFQQLISTGSSPILDAIHEETQTNFYYRVKADYFHFSVMADPAIAFLGSNYNWSAADLESTDDRVVEKYFIELGFDYGHFSLLLFPSSAPNIGVQALGQFSTSTINAPKVGLSYQDQRVRADAFAESGNGDSFTISAQRLNVGYTLASNLDLTASLIQRKITYSQSIGVPSFQYEGHSFTSAIYANRYFAKKFYVGALLSREKMSRTYGLTDLSNANGETAWKGGLNFTLGF